MNWFFLTWVLVGKQHSKQLLRRISPRVERLVSKGNIEVSSWNSLMNQPHSKDIQEMKTKSRRLDITMMTTLAAMERTEKQWRALLGAAGLRVDRFVPYAQPLGEQCIIVAVPAASNGV